jgi:NTE family protein
MSEESPVALVLSGGGARGAYEVGVIAGIVEALGASRGARGAFDIFTGTSVGAINAAYLAAHADASDLGIQGLIDHWESLELNKHLLVDHKGILRSFFRLPFRRRDKVEDAFAEDRAGRAILDPAALEKLVAQGIPWARLRENVRQGIVHALVVSALDVAGGRTTMFADHAPNVGLHPSKDPRRLTRDEPITSEHVLASAAIPLLFPARRLGNTYYCDGGLRFNTPISPAIRAGAEKLIVISLLHRKTTPVLDRADLLAYPNPLFLMGKVLNALLLDPVDYDLQVLDRLNKIMGVLERTLDPSELAEFIAVLERERGTSYRRVETLVFRPSEDIGVLAGKFLREEHLEWRGTARAATFILRRARALGTSSETDLASFLLFDGEFAKALIALGRRDALGRANEIRDFFGEQRRTIPPPPR